MSDDWDADDFEPPAPGVQSGGTDKWEGEDEEEEIKDNWEDSDDEKKEKPEGEDSKGTTVYQRPKKKPLAERIAEKEAKRQQEFQEELKKNREPTAEEKLAEKIRLRKVQLASDLKNAEEIFGVKGQHIEAMFPETEEEFDKFRDAIKSKITEFEASKLYAGFIEKLFQDLSVGLQSEDLKRIGTSLNGLYHEKERQRKEAEKKKKKKQKAIVKVERGDLDLIGGVGEYDYNDDEDFM